MHGATQSSQTVKKALKSDKLEKLLAEKATLENQIDAEEAKLKEQERKDDTRSKIIVGGAILADMKIHPETRGGVMAILQKAVTAPRDRELLQRRGLLG